MLLLVVAGAILTALGPVALKLLVDGYTGHRHVGAASALLLVALYALSQWLARIAGELRGLIYRRIQCRMFRTLSERLFTHLMLLPLRFHLDRQTGAVSETLTNGLEGVQLVLNHLVLTILPVTIELATVLIVLARMAPPPLLALFCAALAFYTGVFGHSAAPLAQSARAAAAARVDAGAVITDGLLNYETVKYFAAESSVQERVGKALACTETEWRAFSRLFARNGLLVASIYAAFLAATTAYATIDTLHGGMTIGDFVLVNTYMLQLVRPLEMLGHAVQSCFQGLAMLERLTSLFRQTPERPPGIRTRPMAGPGALEFDGVSLSYRKDRPVLRDVSFRIGPKRTLGIVGPSGSGKSTLVRLVMRLLEPDEGRILLDGVPISNLDLLHLRSAIAVVPQDTVLFNDTLAYNIALGRAHAGIADVERAARVAHLHQLVTGLPDGYATPVGERGIKLSGGERQRVSIARAVLKSPRIYVFDEATSSLDSQTEQDILASLREIARHSSTLVIAHRLSTVLHADEIAVLDGGQIVERGTHAGLLREGGRYAGLWRAQHHGSAA
ncbi:MAG: ABC transporter ATP-binding protein/permease [Proteobacteria bacterium]|nr:ABC transporter ATP-binding protein/permease [Pseudomonadota bacterium]